MSARAFDSEQLLADLRKTRAGAAASRPTVYRTLAEMAALAAGVAGAAGDNTVALAIAQLSTKKIAGLGNQTFSENYSSAVGSLGQSLASVNDQISSQNIVQKMLSTQRDSVSGVSLDEEMTDMMRFQRAYQANAKLISVIDQMLQTAIGLAG